MLGLAIAEVFLNASVLCVLLFMIAKYEADYSFPKVAMVTAGLVLGNMIVQVILTPHLPKGYEWLLFVAMFAFTAFMIMTFCWITFWKSALVVILFFSWQVGVTFAMEIVKNRIDPSTAKTRTLQEKQMEDMQLIQEEMQRQNRSHRQKPRSTPEAPPETKREVNETEQATRQPPPSSDSTPTEPASDLPGTPKEWGEARSKIKVQGTMSFGGKNHANINGVIVEENQSVSVTHKGHTYSWIVKSISRNGIHLQPERRAPAK